MTKTVVVILAVLMLPEGLLSMVDDNGPNGYVSLRHRAQAEYAERLFPNFKSTFYSEIPFWSAASKTVALYGDFNIGKRDNIGSGGFSNITSNNYPLVYPNPVDSTGKVRISAEYASVEGITSVHVEIRGPNLGSAKASLTPPPIGSLSLSLESGSIHDGVWSGSYTFPNHLPDGNYIYSVVTKDTSGNTNNYGPFSGIVLDRHTKDNVVGSDTKIVYAIDGNGKHIPINGITPSSDITFVFNGSDRTGVVLEFQCNIDDKIVPMGHENALDRSLPTTTYAPCFLPNKIAPTMTGNHTYTNLGIGNHTFKVRLMNNEYNLDSSPATFNWTVTP